MNRKHRRVGRALALVLAVALALPVLSVPTAGAAGPDFVGGPLAEDMPLYVPNDHTPMGIRFEASGLATSTAYEVKVRLSPNPNPSGVDNRGFTWNPTTGQWVRNRGVAWAAGNFPTVTTDASGNITQSPWFFFKFGNENNAGQYYIIVTINKGLDGDAQNAVTKPIVTVLDMKTNGTHVHNGTQSTASTTVQSDRRVIVAPGSSTNSTATIWSISRTDTNTVDDDSNGIADDEDWGMPSSIGDYRLAAPSTATVDVWVQQNRRVNDVTLSNADEDIALGVADQSAPTSPTALSATTSDGKVTLTWDASTDNVGVTKYNIYRWVEANSVEYTPAHVRIGSATTTAFDDPNVTGGVQYSYEVRAVDAATNESARSSTHVIEAAPPIPTISATANPVAPNGADGWYRGAAPTISLTSGAPAMFSWDTTASAFTTATGPITAPEGVHTLYYYAEDSYLQRSDTASATFKVDTAKPSSTVRTPAISTNQTSTRTFRIYLNATDLAPSSSIESYDLDTKVGASGTWKRLRTMTSDKVISLTGSAGATYYYRVRAHDGAGNVGSWSPTAMTIVPYNDTALSFSGSWSKVLAPSSYIGNLHRTRSGSSASLSFKGGSAAYLIATTGANRARVRVYRDGNYIKTISLYSATTKYRQNIYLCSLKGSGSHTIRLVAVPVAGRPYVDVDGLAVKR